MKLKKNAIFIMILVLVLIIIGVIFTINKMSPTKIKLQTTQGEIIIELYEDMPITAGNFEIGSWNSVNTGGVEAFEADLTHGRRGDPDRLGKFSWVKTYDDKIIYNLYGQFNLGYLGRHTNYEAIYNGMTLICKHAIDNNVLRLGLPRNMGCRLGGGSWNVVSAMIYDIFQGQPLQLFICNYDG